MASDSSQGKQWMKMEGLQYPARWQWSCYAPGACANMEVSQVEVDAIEAWMQHQETEERG